MDVLRRNGLRHLVVLLDEIDLSNLGLEEETTSHTDTPEKTKERGRKSHIPSVTTVPREELPESADRQARRRPIAVRDEKDETKYPSPAATNETTTEAEVSRIRDTPNPAVDSRSDDCSSPAATQGSIVGPRSGAGPGQTPPPSIHYLHEKPWNYSVTIYKYTSSIKLLIIICFYFFWAKLTEKQNK